MHRLERLFAAEGVDYKAWERTGSGCKTIENLAHEVVFDGVRVFRRKDRRPVTYRKRVLVHVVYEDPCTGKSHKVEEKYRIYRDGTFRTRTFRTPEESEQGLTEPSFSETVPDPRLIVDPEDESVAHAAMQGLSQELKILRPSRNRLTIYPRASKNAHRSATYLGLDAFERRFEGNYLLVKSECRRIWIERASDRVCTILGWRDNDAPSFLPPVPTLKLQQSFERSPLTNAELSHELRYALQQTLLVTH
jgi:hypothetical protein